ncbi:TPA: hypothetical protein ACGIK7_003887 [Acinetobacter baumannii]
MSAQKANTLIKPEDVVLWIPGNVTIDSMNAGWENIAIRGYEYTDLDVHIPAMRDYMITPISTLNKLFKLNRRITTFFIHNDADRM